MATDDRHEARTGAYSLTHEECIALAARAEGIAAILHRGQADKSGDDYVHHLRRVAANFDPLESPVEHAAAWLHDTIEDCDLIPEDLRDAGVPQRVLEIVVLLTRSPGVSDENYYRSIRRDPAALRVKLADIADNSEPGRLAMLDADTRARLTTKYARALEALGTAG